MKVLIILQSNYPYPLIYGGQQAVFHMIDYLRHKVDISLIYNANGLSRDNELGLQKKWGNVAFFPYRKHWKEYAGVNQRFIKKVSDKVKTKFLSNNQEYKSYKTIEIKKEFDKEFLELINQVIVDEKIDLVQTEFLDTISLVYALPKNVKKVFIQHEIGYIKNKLYLDGLKNKTIDLDYLYELNKAFEIQSMNQYDAVIALTQTDVQKLYQDGVKIILESSPACIPPKVQMKEMCYSENRISFLGGYNHKPNSDGLKWFLDNVWDILLSFNKTINLDVIGAWPKAVCEDWRKKYKNIEFKGIVENLSDVLCGSVMIVPILVGSGMRMKILEAVNHGCPFVSTSVGVEGLSFEDGINCFIDDIPIHFAQKIVKLLEDKKLQKDFWKNSKKVYDDNYSLEQLGKKRLDIYKIFYEGN